MRSKTKIKKDIIKLLIPKADREERDFIMMLIEVNGLPFNSASIKKMAMILKLI